MGFVNHYIGKEMNFDILVRSNLWPGREIIIKSQLDPFRFDGYFRIFITKLIPDEAMRQLGLELDLKTYPENSFFEFESNDLIREIKKVFLRDFFPRENDQAPILIAQEGQENASSDEKEDSWSILGPQWRK